MDAETKQEFEKIGQSIEDLAVITKRGFDAVVSKDELQSLKTEMNNRFDIVESDISRIRIDINQIRNDIKQIWNTLDDLEQRMTQVATASREDIDAMSNSFLNLKKKFEWLESQFKKLQTA